MNIINKPLVSICMITYNHEKYISEAIEGIIMQKTTFPIELIIGEDCSTDNTREIVKAYVKQYPEVIIAQFPDENRGVINNLVTVMQSAQGKYIALCEGDDYWTDPYKLQKQVDILEENIQYSACACQSRIIYETNKDKWRLLNNSTENRIITINDIINDILTIGGGFQTASFIFRKENICNLSFPEKIFSADKFLFILNSYRGYIYWLKDVMTVYRRHERGVSSGVTFKSMQKDLNMIPCFSQINGFPINALKAHIYYMIISRPKKINTFNLLKYYVYILFYIRKSEIDMTVLKQGTKKTLEYQFPRFLRRIFRKIKVL